MLGQHPIAATADDATVNAFLAIRVWRECPADPKDGKHIVRHAIIYREDVIHTRKTTRS